MLDNNLLFSLLLATINTISFFFIKNTDDTLLDEEKRKFKLDKEKTKGELYSEKTSMIVEKKELTMTLENFEEEVKNP